MKSKNLYVKSAKVQKYKTCGNKRYKNINKKHGKEWSWTLFDSQKMCTVVTKLQK